LAIYLGRSFREAKKVVVGKHDIVVRLGYRRTAIRLQVRNPNGAHIPLDYHYSVQIRYLLTSAESDRTNLDFFVQLPVDGSVVCKNPKASGLIDSTYRIKQAKRTDRHRTLCSWKINEPFRKECNYFCECTPYGIPYTLVTKPTIIVPLRQPHMPELMGGLRRKLTGMTRKTENVADVAGKWFVLTER
jgi:hypothetical protein